MSLDEARHTSVSVFSQPLAVTTIMSGNSEPLWVQLLC